MKKEDKIKEGLFLSSSRRFGENYIELFVRKVLQLKKAVSKGEFDAVDQDGLRYEIKAVRVLQPNKRIKLKKSKRDSVKEVKLSELIMEEERAQVGRSIPFLLAKKNGFAANFQNVKRDDFDVLIYVLCFADCIKVFSAYSSEISHEIFPKWCGKHGRYDALGKSGQFVIDQNNLKWHEKNHLVASYTFKEAYQVFEDIVVYI